MKKLIIAILVLLSLKSFSQIEIRGTAIYFKNLNDATTHYITSVDDAWLVTGNTAITGDATIQIGAHTLDITANDGGGNTSEQKHNGAYWFTKTIFASGASARFELSEDHIYPYIQYNDGAISTRAFMTSHGWEGQYADTANYTGNSLPIKDAVLDWIANASGGGGSSPAGNYGNVQINRNGAFDTPASDSVSFTTSGGLNVKNKITSPHLFASVGIDVGTYYGDASVALSIQPPSTWAFNMYDVSGNPRMMLRATGQLGLGPFSPSTGIQFEQRILTSGTVGYWIKRAAGQTAEIQIWGDESGNALSWIDANGKLNFAATITTGGTTGNQTINKPTGTVNIAAAGTNVTVTNSYCTTSSIVYAIVRTNDATATGIKNIVPGSGSFVITLNAAATAEVSIGFIVFN